MNDTFIVPHPQKPGWWLVCLGGGTYEVTEAYHCSCPSHHYRGRCKHADAVAAEVRRESACAACGGTGRLQLRERYAGEAPFCLVCDGSGRRAGHTAAEDAALRRIFR